MPGLVRRSLLGLHALVVLLLIVLFYAVSATGPETDANIGAGIIGLALLAWGLPWTMLIWLIEPHTYDGFSTTVRGLIDFGPAVINVVIHGVLGSMLARRRSRTRAPAR